MEKPEPKTATVTGYKWGRYGRKETVCCCATCCKAFPERLAMRVKTNQETPK